MSNHNEISSFIWKVCDDLLRDVFKNYEYGDIILPFLVLRRLDCVLEPKKKEVVEFYDSIKGEFEDPSEVLMEQTNMNFTNYSKFDLVKLKEDPNKLKTHIDEYISGYSSNVREILSYHNLNSIINKLHKNNRLYKLIELFTQVDLHPNVVNNHTMGRIFEELLRRFSEMSNETSGEHYTPRDIVSLLVSLVFSPDKDKLQERGKIISVFDPCCGTGGMLTVGKEWVHDNINKDISVNLFGQELNETTYSICKSDFLITDENPNNIKLGSSLSQDGFPETDRRFDYMITNPPFGVSWKSEKSFIEDESQRGGRFNVGTPRVSDGSLLFLQHMISKMETQGSRIGVVFNGSPLFTGDSGSGESEIRKWIIENDWLESIVSLPDQLFFNTGISTYIWIVTNKKNPKRKGKVQLIDGSSFYKSMKKSLGSKRKFIDDSQREQLLQTYQNFEENEHSKIFDNEFFGYTKITIEQPKVEDGEVVRDKKGNPKPDSKLRDYERVPLSEDIEEYFNREVEPHLPNSWIDFDKSKVGYEINFTKYFYKYKPLRSSNDISNDLLELKKESENLLNLIMD
jgi:type I restriction enzyme M protein